MARDWEQTIIITEEGATTGEGIPFDFINKQEVNKLALATLTDWRNIEPPFHLKTWSWIDNLSEGSAHLFGYLEGKSGLVNGTLLVFNTLPESALAEKIKIWRQVYNPQFSDATIVATITFLHEWEHLTHILQEPMYMDGLGEDTFEKHCYEKCASQQECRVFEGSKLVYRCHRAGGYEASAENFAHGYIMEVLEGKRQPIINLDAPQVSPKIVQASLFH